MKGSAMQQVAVSKKHFFFSPKHYRVMKGRELRVSPTPLWPV